MRYTLLSRGRTLGYTELDLPHIDDCIRMGFIEPTDDGVRLLPVATGVSAAAGALANAARRAARGHGDAITEFADFRAACDRREALNLELRDEMGILLQYEWIQVNDIDDQAWIEDDAADDEDLDPEWLEQLEEDSEPDPECQAAVAHDVELMDADLDGDDWKGESARGTADDRWNWFRYHLMVRLPRCRRS